MEEISGALPLDKRFRLAQCRHVQISQDITQVLLRQSSADSRDRQTMERRMDSGFPIERKGVKLHRSADRRIRSF